MSLNLYCSVQKAKIDAFLLFHATDMVIYNKLDQMGYDVFYHESVEGARYSSTLTRVEEGKQEGQRYGTVGYQGLINSRISFVLEILQRGYQVLLCDADIVFLRNPFLFLDLNLDLQAGAHKSEKVTGGFISIKASTPAISFWTEVFEKHTKLFKEMQQQQEFDPHKSTEQEIINHMLLGPEKQSLKWGRLPHEVVADGYAFFISQAVQKNGIWPAAIHNNYVIGKENKKSRLRTASLWLLQDSSGKCRPPAVLPPPPPPLPSSRSPASFLSIKVLTFNRPSSLAKLLWWLFRADYLGDRVSLVIYVDKAGGKGEEGGEAKREREQVVEVARSFKWPYGEKKVVVRKKAEGLLNQWLNSWLPTSEQEVAMILEDDNIVSPFFYRWLKDMVGRFYFDPANHDPRIFGIAMQNQHMIPGRYPTTPSSLLPPDILYYRYQQMSTWGPVFFPGHWREFLKWYEAKQQQSDFVPVFSNLITNDWFLMKGSRAVWSAWFMRFVAERGWYCINTNFPDGKAFVVNNRDPGVNYQKYQGPNSPMVDSLEGIQIPESLQEMPIFDFHFNQILEHPSILEDRGFYSDMYNVKYN